MGCRAGWQRPYLSRAFWTKAEPSAFKRWLDTELRLSDHELDAEVNCWPFDEDSHDVTDVSLFHYSGGAGGIKHVVSLQWQSREPDDSPNEDGHNVVLLCRAPQWYTLARDLMSLALEEFHGKTTLDERLSSLPIQIADLCEWPMELSLGWSQFCRWLKQEVGTSFAWFETTEMGYQVSVLDQPKDGRVVL
jgi:hypothetical protein